MHHDGADAETRAEQKARHRALYRKISAIVKLCLLLVLVIGIPSYIFFFHHDLLDRFSSIHAIEAFFLQYRSQSILIYLGLQILQLVICIIPGQALQFAAGYLFHFWLGFLLTMIGAFLGTILTYYLAKILGHDAMHMIFGEEKITNMLSRINSKRGVSIVFLIYLIPGIPKDLCTYAAGLSEMKLKPFLLLSMIGRAPGMIGSLLVGQQVQMGGYTSAAVIGGIALVLCVLGLIFRRQLTDITDRIYGKLQKML